MLKHMLTESKRFVNLYLYQIDRSSSVLTI